MYHRSTKVLLSATILSALLLTGCTTADSKDSPAKGPEATSEQTKAPEEKPTPEVVLSLPEGKDKNIAPDQLLEVTLTGSTLAQVKVTGQRLGERGQAEKVNVRLKGVLANEKWIANGFMEPSTKYTVKAIASDGSVHSRVYQTKKVPLSKQTYPTVYPASGAVGIGQPVVIKFDVPIKNKKLVEENLSVETAPKQAGSWRWISDQEVRWRPKAYWRAGTRVKVKAKVNSLPTGNGVYGQFDQDASFRISDVARRGVVNMDNQTITVFKNGKKIRTIPVSTGEEPAFTTRSGTKVIMSKHRHYTMNSGTIGIDPNSGDGYNLKVEYAMRVTSSGEFFHSAPWNTAYFGRRGASHGCIGSSMADSAWLYSYFQVGDPIEFTGTSKRMTVENGYGDWTMKFNEYKKGSAFRG